MNIFLISVWCGNLLRRIAAIVLDAVDFLVLVSAKELVQLVQYWLVFGAVGQMKSPDASLAAAMQRL